ncbi:hypothetical protein M9Y10_006124 [Tritrichomonas musculus]|uniref:EF-hand domain-containing protein n=1 Tax=Tritrichomonas musculus TaxID=1915356 RepID=A0ABR2JDU5_9EUKA
MNESKKSISSETKESNLNPNSSEIELESIPGDKWIDKLKYAFDEIDTNRTGSISFEQWMSSRLRLLVSNEPVTEKQMKEIFNTIDINCDNSIQWNELVDFLLTNNTGIGSQSVEKKLKISFVAPNDLILRKSKRQSANFKIIFLPAHGEIVTLSDAAITFWSPEDCDPICTFTDNDAFVDFCDLKCLSKIVIAKSNRQLIFFDIRTHKKINFTVSAALDNSEIPKMTYKEAKSSIVSRNIRQIPLFNTPTTIYAHDTQPLLFVGDDDGNIEIIKIMTSGSSKLTWSSTRINQIKLHNDDVTQIQYLNDNEVYCSSSLDGTFQLWRYTHSDNQLQRAYKVSIRNSTPILTFVYDSRTKDVVFTTPNHFFGVWRTFTTHQELIETKSDVFQTLQIIQLSKDSSICVAISKGNSIALYRMPSMEIITSHYLGLQHELCPPRSALYLSGDLYLAGSFLSRWSCINNTDEDLSAHKSPIVDVMTNDVFGRVLSIDQYGEFISWDIQNGKKICVVSINELHAIVLCAVMDKLGRRIAVGYSNGAVKFYSANSGTFLAEIEKDAVTGGCNYVLFDTIFNTDRIICCSANHYAVLFEDLSGHRVRFVRKFIGHTEPVTRCAVIKGKFLLTIGAEHELFLWNIQMQNPTIKYNLPNDPTVALDLPNNNDIFLCGDVMGNINLMRLDSPNPVSTFKGIGMSIKSPLTTLFICPKSSFLISGNLHGYIKYWSIQDGGKFIEQRRFRAHNEAILSISFSEDFNVMVTGSRDEEIKIWSLEPLALLGSLGKEHKFVLADQTTWESFEPLPDDPFHFMDKFQADIAVYDRERLHSIRSEKSPGNVATVKSDRKSEGDVNSNREVPFSLENVTRMCESMEDLCLSGRKYLELAAKKDDEMSKSASIKEPPPVEIDIVDNNLITDAIQMIKQARSRPKIWRPKGKA